MNATLDGKHIRVYDAFSIKESIKEIRAIWSAVKWWLFQKHAQYSRRRCSW